MSSNQQVIGLAILLVAVFMLGFIFGKKTQISKLSMIEYKHVIAMLNLVFIFWIISMVLWRHGYFG